MFPYIWAEALNIMSKSRKNLVNRFGSRSKKRQSRRGLGQFKQKYSRLRTEDIMRMGDD